MPRKKLILKVPPPKQTRGPRGEGSVMPDPRSGGWKAKVPVGRTPEGRTRYVWVRALTHADVVAKKRLVQPPDPNALTLGEWLDRWLATTRIAPQTKESYTADVALYLKPQLGALLIRELTSHHVEAAAAALARPAGPIGPNTLRRVISRLGTALRAARRARLIADNAVEGSHRVKGKKVAIRPFAPADLGRIVSAAATDPRWHLFALLGSVGCRTGEALALDVPDLDTDTWSLSITKTYSTKHGTRAPKSDTGRRTVRVPKAARPALLAARGARTRGPLFATVAGLRPPHETVRLRWRKLLDRLELPYRNPHQLRHSVATHALAAGYPLPNIARDLGDTVQTVVKTYLHATNGPDLCDAMDEVLKGAAGA